MRAFRATQSGAALGAFFAVTLAGCSSAPSTASRPPPRYPVSHGGGAPSPSAAVDLTPARALNQQAVRAYAEGRYRDAWRYFEEGLRLGGPPSELWNIARCQQRLDDAEGAAATLARYLEVPSLTADERAEARRELAEIQGRPSRLTVVSAPQGAQVYLDDRRSAAVGRTPFTITVPPGEHTVVVELAGSNTATRTVSARYGRAVIVAVVFSR